VRPQIEGRRIVLGAAAQDERFRMFENGDDRVRNLAQAPCGREKALAADRTRAGLRRPGGVAPCLAVEERPWNTKATDTVRSLGDVPVGLLPEQELGPSVAGKVEPEIAVAIDDRLPFLVRIERRDGALKPREVLRRSLGELLVRQCLKNRELMPAAL
jgi:hypothetical protein